MLARSDNGMSNQTYSRELTQAERLEIRTLVEKNCANYDRAAKECLPLECACYMLGKWWTGAYCQYFLNSVLPLAPMLEASLTGRDAKTVPCGQCGQPFIPKSRQVYCSPACAEKARLKRQREYMQKRRDGC